MLERFQHIVRILACSCQTCQEMYYTIPLSEAKWHSAVVHKSSKAYWLICINYYSAIVASIQVLGVFVAEYYFHSKF